MIWSDLFFEAWQWWRHRLRSRIRHGVHSPFVFGLQDGTLKEAALLEMASIEARRKALLADQRLIHRLDLGAGSRHKNEKIMTVRDFAHKSLQREHAARILRGLADGIQANEVLELGTAFGITTAYLAWNHPKRRVSTIEGDPEVLAIAQEQWHELDISNINAYVGSFDEHLQKDPLSKGKFDLILIDGHHTYEATMRYWNQLKKQVSPKGCIVLDDIYWSPGMNRAWAEIKQDPLVTLTLDYFEWGVVFMFPRQQIEHFSLRLPTMNARTRHF